ncbi:MAG: cation:proton antiporter [Methylomonas lenta]|nr:cation:proton antiporter [Methylomonas lenta]
MELFYILLILLFVTRLFGELAVRLKQPALVGELVSGIILGIIVRGYSETFVILHGLQDNEVFSAVSDLAIFFLMLLTGIEMQPRDLARASADAFFVALGGMLLPLTAGFALAWYFIPTSPFKFSQALFLAISLSVTAVPVAARVLMDIGYLETRIGHTIISAAIFNDILSLILLASLTAVIHTGGLPRLDHLAGLSGMALLFFAIAILAGYTLFPLGGRLLKLFRSDEIDFTALLVVAFAFALLAEALKLHFILGAFLAGLFFVQRTIDPHAYIAVKARVSGITTGFLAPIFFASIGMHFDISSANSVPLFVILLILIAFLCKLIGAGGPALLLGFHVREALAVGVGMSARGAVELIIADIALRAGLFDVPQPVPDIIRHLFSAIVIMTLATTLLTPLVLRQILRSPRNSDK